MHFDNEKQVVQLDTLAEYLVVRNGLGVGLRLIDRSADRHPSLSDADILGLQKAQEDMPLVQSKEQLPYSITVVQAKIAIKGLYVAGPQESALARDKRQKQRIQLEELLKP